MTQVTVEKAWTNEMRMVMIAGQHGGVVIEAVVNAKIDQTNQRGVADAGSPPHGTPRSLSAEESMRP